MTNDVNSELLDDIVYISRTISSFLLDFTDEKYYGRPDRQMFIAYVSTILSKLMLEEVIDEKFKSPVALQLQCLEIAEDIYEQLSK